ncbi:glutamate 5-kinase [Limimonas halophila]|uniref:Glutamate 5-kinase n=1 Tax=Limimonas halophila TaxID=1082479 RepID=A0A1G7TIU1_9PROT|nr:glutamate 5-kinase [Limimonas halophila]SDG35175.1 glutamate 5-kinase [Limimonas halophila]
MSDSSTRAAGRPDLTALRRVVVKIGSNLLVDAETGALKRAWLDALVDDIAELRRHGVEVAVVSSGAISAGRRQLGLTRDSIRLEEKQAAAAAGQIRLAHAYQESLARHELTVAQILITLADTEERRRHLNARSTVGTLLSLGAVPVINENDTVATNEIRFGDNDRLAARVAAMIDAEALVLLSDVDGLYAGDPRRDPDAAFVPRVDAITPEIERMAGAAPRGYSTGGMVTKLAAARVALTAGCHMAIAQGHVDRPLRHMRESGRCTWFVAAEEPRAARKRWIAGSLSPAGRITVDDGAQKALRRGTSLLPAGVVAVGGTFERGDAVVVQDRQGRELARGLIAYSADAARRIAGRKSAEIADILGYSGREELIHRDDLALTTADDPALGDKAADDTAKEGER